MTFANNSRSIMAIYPSGCYLILISNINKQKNIEKIYTHVYLFILSAMQYFLSGRSLCNRKFQGWILDRGAASNLRLLKTVVTVAKHPALFRTESHMSFVPHLI